MENKTSFGPFLTTLQQQKSARTSVVREARRKVLTTLAESGHLPVEKLRLQVQMRFEDFADTVKGLKDAELIEVELKDSDEIVLLTDKGRQIADLDW